MGLLDDKIMKKLVEDVIAEMGEGDLVALAKRELVEYLQSDAFTEQLSDAFDEKGLGYGIADVMTPMIKKVLKNSFKTAK